MQIAEVVRDTPSASGPDADPNDTRTRGACSHAPRCPGGPGTNRMEAETSGSGPAAAQRTADPRARVADRIHGEEDANGSAAYQRVAQDADFVAHAFHA